MTLRVPLVRRVSDLLRPAPFDPAGAELVALRKLGYDERGTRRSIFTAQVSAPVLNDARPPVVEPVRARNEQGFVSEKSSD